MNLRVFKCDSWMNSFRVNYTGTSLKGSFNKYVTVRGGWVDLIFVAQRYGAWKYINLFSHPRKLICAKYLNLRSSAKIDPHAKFKIWCSRKLIGAKINPQVNNCMKFEVYAHLPIN